MARTTPSEPTGKSADAYAAFGSWQLAHERRPLAESELSKKIARPRSAIALSGAAAGRTR
jgi:hypothetical protein